MEFFVREVDQRRDGVLIEVKSLACGRRELWDGREDVSMSRESDERRSSFEGDGGRSEIGLDEGDGGFVRSLRRTNDEVAERETVVFSELRGVLVDVV